MMGRETERDLAAMVKVEKRAKETARAERDDLRRQVANEREQWRQLAQDTQYYIGEAADLRRQLAEAQAELAATRIAMQAYAALAAICPTCGGSGEVDSGGVTPWGAGIDVTCPTCGGSGKVYDVTPHRTGEGDA